MRPTIRTLLVIAVAALLAPSATATWYTLGTYEPDNGLDAPNFMRFDPPGTATNLIYFNVISGTSPGLRTFSTSPNLGLVESNIEPPQTEAHTAILGVWIDCNGDGYVGMAAGALREYPSQLLLDTSVCPPATGLVTRWTAGAHNYNGWVSELVPIAGVPLGGNVSSDLRLYHDPEAMVWGDQGRPDDSATAGGSCAISPQPRGTYQSTGGFLNFVDCSSGLMERYNSAFDGVTIAGQEIPGLYDFGIPDAGTYFANDDDARGHAFWDRPTFGSEDSANAAVSAIDCDSQTFHSGDTLNQTPLGPSVPSQLQNIAVRGVSPSLVNPTGATIPGQVNQTQEEAVEDCDTSNDNGHDFYGGLCNFANACVGEADHNSVGATNKRAAEWNFQFWIWDRGVRAFGLGPQLPVAPGGPAGFAIPGKPGSMWDGGSSSIKVPATVRASIVEGTVEIADAPHRTFYAHVGAATTTKGFATPGGSGAYGQAQCGANESGVHNGWNCDSSTWYRNADGSAVAEPFPFARPGQAYEFRDVDCYDGNVGALGLGVGLPYYGEGPCAR